MLLIKVPNNHIYERTYIIETILKDFLGLEYKMVWVDHDDYVLTLENKNELIFRDCFFSRFQEEGLQYLNENNIPSTVSFAENRFTIESDIPILFGNEDLVISKEKIISGADIFASSFFMLTRWEEYVNPIRDQFQRFTAKESVAGKFNFLHRAIVNEYVEFLWNMLEYLGFKQERRKREYHLFPTHDVDQINLWKDTKSMVKSVGRSLIKQNDLSGSVHSFLDYVKIKCHLKKDPYHTFDWMMDLSETAGLKSRFYFMSGGLTKYDNFYNIQSPQTKRIIEQILVRGHIVGFHPSFQTYDNPQQFQREKSALESVVGFEVKEGRHHYLRFTVPHTWQQWEDHGLTCDSTLSYADCEGFRCGTCYEFHPFNILTRKKLSLKEYPLIAMEVSLAVYQAITPSEMLGKIEALVDTVKKFDGNFVFLWHNSNFHTGQWSDLRAAYESTITKLSAVPDKGTN